MRLSKIYRTDESRLEQMQMLSFDTPEGRAAQPGYRSSHTFRAAALPVDSCGTVDVLDAAAPGQETEPAASSVAAPVPSPIPAPAVEMPNVEAIQEEARQQGYQDGLQAGEARLDQASQALNDALMEVKRLREGILSNSRQDMLSLVMAISEQVVQQELSLKPEAILPVVERALKSAVRSDSFRIQVHPDDLAAVTEHKPLFLASVSGLSNIAFEADPHLTPGGCRIESDLGEVDASLETQMEEIRNALAAAMGDE